MRPRAHARRSAAGRWAFGRPRLLITAYASLLTCLAGLVAASPGQADVLLKFNQVDYTLGGAPIVVDSEWGEFGVTYDQGSSMQWINVVANPTSPSASWIVQNHPLAPSSLTGTTSFSSVGYFDLGVPRGANVSSLDVLVQIGASPLTVAPSTGTIETVPVGTVQNIINSGVPSGLSVLNPPVTNPIGWSPLDQSLDTNWHNGMPNVTQEQNFCGPGAATNSLQWLNDQHDLGLTQTLSDTQTELAGNMNNNNDGNWDDAEVQGKLQYIAEHGLPIEVHYVGGVMLPTDDRNFEDPNDNGTARNDGAVTWAWLQQEMEKGQDIELMTNTHWVVMEGLISWDDVHLFSYRDDPFQKGAATTANQQQTIDDRHVWTYFSDGKVNIGNGEETLQAAVAESVYPEPGSAWLLSLGLAGLVAAHRRRRGA